MNIYGVIMAGGGGTRFWPLSRNNMPKQLLNLSGQEIMINETIERLLSVVEREHLLVVTNKAQAANMTQVTAGRIKASQILSEPSSRNTAACVGYAAMEILKKHGDGIMIITPSDAYIRDIESYSKVLSSAVEAARDTNQLVTIGITPSFPATGYGYMKYDWTDTALVKKVIQFQEKPNEETAKSYLESGDYAWNSGMFIWKASVILENFQRFLPQVYEKLVLMGEAMGTDEEQEVITRLYPTMQSISIDYGIMERSSEVVMIPGTFGWNDVGSWDMLGVLHESDEAGNVIVGAQVNIDTTNTISYSSGKLIATIGVDDLIIVETPDAILVCDKERAQDVKKVVEELKARNEIKYL